MWMIGLTPPTVHERLQELLRTFFNDDEIVLDSGLTPAEVPGWDSVAHVNLLFSIENEFGIHFSDAELETLSSVGALESSLQRKLGA
jgi:acyl carrier protein